MDGDYYIQKYNEEFNKLWVQFSKNELEHLKYKAAMLIQNRFRGRQAVRKFQKMRKVYCEEHHQVEKR